MKKGGVGGEGNEDMKKDDRQAGRGAGVSIERAQRGNGVIARVSRGRDANQGQEEKTHTHEYRIVGAWVRLL
jgi:hypothetical protein